MIPARNRTWPANLLTPVPGELQDFFKIGEGLHRAATAPAWYRFGST
jgi:hypothetical protein